jgi:hypothetical protein
MSVLNILRRLDAYLTPGSKPPGSQQKPLQVPVKPQSREPVKVQPVIAVVPRAKTVPQAEVIEPIQDFSAQLLAADSVDECMALYRNTTSESSEERLVIEKIERLATSFDEWQEVAENTAADSTLGVRAYDRMSKLAKNLFEWLAVYNGVTDPALKEQAAQHISKIVSETGDWDALDGELTDGDELMSRLTGIRISTLATLAECEELYGAVAEDSSHAESIIRRIRECTEPLVEWVSAYENHSDADRFTDALLEGMLARVVTPSDWVSVIEVTDAVDSDMKKVREELEKVVWSKEEWETFRKEVPSDYDDEDFATLKIMDYYTEVPELISFYLDCCAEWDLQDETLDAMRARIVERASASEAKIIALLTDDDALRDKAEGK